MLSPRIGKHVAIGRAQARVLLIYSGGAHLYSLGGTGAELRGLAGRA